jgi:hypothetical protein
MSHLSALVIERACRQRSQVRDRKLFRACLVVGAQVALRALAPMLFRMRIWVLAVAIALGCAVRAEAVELANQWKANEVRRYRYEETAHVGSQLVTVRSTFRQRARAVRPGSIAEVEVTIEGVEICSGRPAHCVHRPGRALLFEIDGKGRVTAPQVLTVYLHNDQVRLALRDPRASSPGADPAVDVVPLSLFDLLVLPDGDQRPGAKIERRLTPGTVWWSLAAIEGEVARVRVTSAPRTPLSADLAARILAATGELLEARGTLITWQPIKRNSTVVLQRL